MVQPENVGLFPRVANDSAAGKRVLEDVARGGVYS